MNIPVDDISRLLRDGMGRAVANGDNSVSMPDYLVRVANWLSRFSVQHEAAPIDMVLHCPECGTQHIDAVEDLPMAMPGSFAEGSAGWTNPPHRSHLCKKCGHIWRPADVPTNGVPAVKTRGKDDSPISVRPA